MSGRREVLRVLRRTVARALRRRPGAALGLAAWSVLEAAPTMVFGQTVARAVDAFRSGSPAVAACWLAVMAVAAPAGAYGGRRMYGCLAAIVEPLRDDLVRWVVRGALRRSLAGRPDTGAVARLTHQVEIVRDTFAGVLMVMRGFLFTVAAALAGLVSLMPVTLLLVGPPVLLALALFCAVMAAAAARQRELIVGEERIAGECTAMAAGLRDIVACGGEGRIEAAMERHVTAQAAAGQAVARMAAVRTLTIALGGWLPLLLLLAAAPWLMRHGATAGTVIGALTYVMQGLHPALNSLVTGLGGGGLRLAVSMTRLMETGTGRLDTVPAAAPVTVPNGTTAPNGAAAAVRMRGVRFAYGAHAEPVIHDLDLFVPCGDHLAVVGPSGIGKSTLAALIAGTLQPGAGLIEVQGGPPGDTRRRAFLPQEPYVFEGTLGENLAYLADGVRDRDLPAAVEAIGLHRLVHRAGGLDAALDPAALSEGERQLIALARAYLSPMPLVILDEATCHLDPVAEERAETALARRPGTLIVIAHRMTSALRARRVLVLDGTSAQLGRHDALLRDSALYRSLVGHWYSQPSALFGDADGVHPVPSSDLVVDPGEMIADRTDR